MNLRVLHFLPHPLLILLGWSLLLLSPERAPSAVPEPSSWVLVAHQTVDSSGRAWIYLAIRSSSPSLKPNGTWSVHLKTGEPSAPAPFQKMGDLLPVSDPSSIQVILSRATALGENLDDLNSQLAALEEIVSNGIQNPDRIQIPSRPLKERLSLLLNHAQSDLSLAGLLDVWARTSPTLRMARGKAWAGLAPAQSGETVTLECREQVVTGKTLRLLGRVSFVIGSQSPLPADGPLVEVPDFSPAGHLSVRLRWATPLALRDPASGHEGDRLWRVDPAFAQNLGWLTSPPTATDLDNAAKTAPLSVHRFAGPWTATHWFTEPEARDLVSDPQTSFFVDDHGRSEEGGSAFQEGERYVYFLAPVDALGRSGQVSPGLPIIVRATLPPPTPAEFTATRLIQIGSAPSIELEWKRGTSSTATTATRYELFKGTNFNLILMAQRGQLDLNRNPISDLGPNALKKIGEINGTPPETQSAFSFLDPLASESETLGRIPWWYLIRAIHDGPQNAPPIYSSFSNPLLVDPLPTRAPPPSPAFPFQQTFTRDCPRVACRFQSASISSAPTEDDSSVRRFRIHVSRRDLTVPSLRLKVRLDNATEDAVPETEVLFPAGILEVEFPWQSTRHDPTPGYTVSLQASSEFGKTSTWTDTHLTLLPPPGNVVTIRFETGVCSEQERTSLLNDPLWRSLAAPTSEDCENNFHLATSPASSQILHPTISFPLTRNTAQYRLYRRIQNGTLSLIAQGRSNYTGPGSSMTIKDATSPATLGEVSYIAQLVDEHGNASPLQFLGTLQFVGIPLPQPILLQPSRLDMTGDPQQPQVTLRWFCAPEFVERFELYVNSKAIEPSPDPWVSTDQQRLEVQSVDRRSWLPGKNLGKAADSTVAAHQRYLTGRVNGDLGPGPKFSLPLQLTPHRSYRVWIRAVGTQGNHGAPSEAIEFQWSPSSSPHDVSWPARPLPRVDGFHPGIQTTDFRRIPASRLDWTGNGHLKVDPNLTPVGIRVGALTLDGNPLFEESPEGPRLNLVNSLAVGRRDPNLQVYTRPGNPAERLLPCVLYRQQITNQFHPTVSGDVVQCSPLIRSIAWRDPAPGHFRSDLLDPFFRWVKPGPLTDPNPLELKTADLDLYLTDTQPVVEGAMYRYWLVRFDARGEPVQTIPAGEVLIEP